MDTPNPKTVSRLPASRFPDPAEVYFCDNCGRDLTKNLHHDRAPLWQPLRPMWYECQCHRKYLSGAAEWDDLSTWEREQRIRQLGIGFVLFAILINPVMLAYLALRYGSPALLVVLAISLIPSISVAKPFGFVLLDVFEIIASISRTRGGRWASELSMSPDGELDKKTQPVTATTKQRMSRSRQHEFRLIPVAAAVIAVLIIATRWIPFHLGPASPLGALSAPQRSNLARQEILSAPAKPPLSHQAQAAITGRAKPKTASPAFRRVQVGPNEVDYIGEDVTIRHFTATPALPRVRDGYKEVHVAEDVTVRYFASNPAVVSQARPVLTVAPAVDRSSPASK